MIAKMLRTTVICRSEDKEQTLAELRDLGCLHVELSNVPESEAQMALGHRILRISQVITALSDRKPKTDEKIAKTPASELFESCVVAMERLDVLKREVDELNKDIEKLKPWGDFSFATIDELAKSGVHVYLCAASRSEIEKLGDKGTVLMLRPGSDISYFILVSDKELDIREIPRASMPSGRLSLHELEQKKSFLQNEINEKNDFLAAAATQIPRLSHYQQCICDDHEFATNSNNMGDDSQGLCFINGYAPEAKAEELNLLARAKGFAVSTRVPEEEELPPTKLEITKGFRMAQAIFDFIGVSPSYREWDVSIAFLVFLTIFFAMLVGDGGYGLIFLAVSLFVKFKVRPKSEAAVNAVNLFLVLSFATITWGFLTGSFFGIHTSHLPSFMRGLDFFNGDDKDKHVQFICFFLAGLHLSVARIWQAFIQGLRRGIGQIGWMMLVWGNFFMAVNLIVFPGPVQPYVFWLYIGGFALICIFGVNWFHIHEVFDLPFGII